MELVCKACVVRACVLRLLAAVQEAPYTCAGHLLGRGVTCRLFCRYSYNKMALTSSYQCSLCHFETRFISLFFKHYRLNHEHLPKFNVQCVVDGCVKSYTNVKSLKKRVYKKHPQYKTFARRTSVETKAIQDVVLADEETESTPETGESQNKADAERDGETS